MIVAKLLAPPLECEHFEWSRVERAAAGHDHRVRDCDAVERGDAAPRVFGAAVPLAVLVVLDDGGAASDYNINKQLCHEAGLYALNSCTCLLHMFPMAEKPPTIQSLSEAEMARPVSRWKASRGAIRDLS